MTEKRKVIIAGAGFAGLTLARKLDEKAFDVLLIDRINYHQFQPLLYQVATAQVEPSSISFPLRHIFRKSKDVKIRLAEVLKIDDSEQKITTTIGDFEYDYLVLAMGCKTNFFGNEQISKKALPLKTTNDAITIRNHMLQTFEDIISADEKERESLKNLVIVGAGPTGVELAGAFAEMKKNILPKDFHRIDFSAFRVILVEGSHGPLGSMSDVAKKASEDYLQKMGVELLPHSIVKDYDGNTLTLDSGKTIKTKSVIWTAGVTPNTIDGIPKDVLEKGNRILVNRYNLVDGLKSVYVIGDQAIMKTSKYPHGHPQLANVAINQAKNLAKNLERLLKGEQPKEYEYVDLGTMATLGRNHAVVDLPFWKFKGIFAWFTWMFLHLMLILSVRNRLIIFINWAIAYFTKDSSLRLILTEDKKKSLQEETTKI